MTILTMRSKTGGLTRRLGKRLKAAEEGAAAMEYGLIAAVISLGIIGSLVTTRDHLICDYNTIAALIVGGSPSCSIGSTPTDTTTVTDGTPTTPGDSNYTPPEAGAQTQLPPGYKIVHTAAPLPYVVTYEENYGGYGMGNGIYIAPSSDPTNTYGIYTGDPSSAGHYSASQLFSQNNVDGQIFPGSMVGQNADGTATYIYAIQDPNNGTWGLYQVTGPDDGTEFNTYYL